LRGETGDYKLSVATGHVYDSNYLPITTVFTIASCSYTKVACMYTYINFHTRNLLASYM